MSMIFKGANGGFRWSFSKVQTLGNSLIHEVCLSKIKDSHCIDWKDFLWQISLVIVHFWQACEIVGEFLLVGFSITEGSYWSIKCWFFSSFVTKRWVIGWFQHWLIKCWFFSNFVTKRWVIDDHGAAWESWWVNGRLKVIEGVMQA